MKGLFGQDWIENRLDARAKYHRVRARSEKGRQETVRIVRRVRFVLDVQV